MNIKKSFHNISWAEFAKIISKLGIDNDLIGWTQSFLIDWWMELVIDGYTNPKYKVETEIL